MKQEEYSHVKCALVKLFGDAKMLENNRNARNIKKITF